MSHQHPQSILFRLVHAGFTSFGMSCLVVLVATILNTGLDMHVVGRWFRAWVLAFPVAWFAAFFWGPTAMRLTRWLLRVS